MLYHDLLRVIYLLAGLKREVETDLEDADPRGFVEKRTKFHIPKYGNSAVYIGKEFMVLDKFKNHEYFTYEDGHHCSMGKIAKVATTKPSNDENITQQLWFKFYDTAKHRRPPAKDSDDWRFARCEDFMTTSATRTMIKWTKQGLIGSNLVGRRVCKLWGNGKYYEGTISRYLVDKKRYEVSFDDGEKKLFAENTVIDMLR
jgi:hypothetical protein